MKTCCAKKAEDTEWSSWKSTKDRKTTGGTRWKKPLGEVCPHGLRIFLVNGTFIRNNFDSDFDQGGNGYRYDFCPKNEIWVDDHVPEAEIPYVVFHECHEIADMKAGMSYDKAHDRAKALEDEARKANHPGDVKRGDETPAERALQTYSAHREKCNKCDGNGLCDRGSILSRRYWKLEAKATKKKA